MKNSLTLTIPMNEFKSFIIEAIKESGISQDLPISTDPAETMNQKEAAEYLGICQSTMIRWKKAGKIPYEQIPGSNKIRFYKSQLKAVVQQNTHLLQASRK